MEKYLVGSTLLKKYFSDYRNPNDTDWVVFDKEHCKQSIVGKEEFHYLPVSPRREMTPNELYTLKVSHAIYDVHWEKTMSDIRFMQMKGLSLDKEFLKTLREFWANDVHKNKQRTNFKVKDLFDDKVVRKIPHDDLHLMLNPPVPTYLKMIIGNEEGGVEPNEEKFNQLSVEEKDNCLFEEAFVISLERFTQLLPRIAYSTAQKALVTRLHPVWLADYVIENWNRTFWNAGGSMFFKKYLELREVV